MLRFGCAGAESHHGFMVPLEKILALRRLGGLG